MEIVKLVEEIKEAHKRSESEPEDRSVALDLYDLLLDFYNITGLAKSCSPIVSEKFDIEYEDVKEVSNIETTGAKPSPEKAVSLFLSGNAKELSEMRGFMWATFSKTDDTLHQNSIMFEDATFLREMALYYYIEYEDCGMIRRNAKIRGVEVSARIEKETYEMRFQRRRP